MGIALRYWQLVRLDMSGHRKIEEYPLAKAFFQAQFSEDDDNAAVDDGAIQRQLWAILKPITAKPTVPEDSSTQPPAPATTPASLAQLAEMCLRCFISHQVERACIQLETQFGQSHGFSRYDLFRFVLDDILPLRLSRASVFPHTSFAAEVLKTFNPEQAGLSSWTMRLVKHHRELNLFLLEHGVYLTSDWAILNDTSIPQLERILTQHYQVSPLELQQAAQLLEAYHAVYRRDRIQQRQSGQAGYCRPPSPEQILEMKRRLSQSPIPRPKEIGIGSQLQYLAQYLRRYRILARGGSPLREAVDLQENQHSLEGQLVDTRTNVLDANDEQEFLNRFRQHLVQELDQALLQVCQVRLKQFEKQKLQAAEPFLEGLHLFHCQGKSMTEMAPLLSMKAQYQVTRFLKLKEFRADVCQQLLQRLKHSTLNLAEQYTDPRCLSQLTAQIEAVLTEQINTLSTAAAAEASVPKNRPTASLFARRLCHILQSGTLQQPNALQGSTCQAGASLANGAHLTGAGQFGVVATPQPIKSGRLVAEAATAELPMRGRCL
jgi:hypothetical protein